MGNNKWYHSGDKLQNFRSAMWNIYIQSMFFQLALWNDTYSEVKFICAMFATLVWTSSEEIFVEGALPTSAFKTRALKATHINFLWSRLLISKGQPQKHWLYFLFWLSLTSLSSYSYSWEQMTIDELRAAKQKVTQCRIFRLRQPQPDSLIIT